MALRIPFLARVADMFGRQHPRTVYYRRPEIVGHEPAIPMGAGTRAGLVSLLVLFIVIMSMVAAGAFGIMALSFYKMFAG